MRSNNVVLIALTVAAAFLAGGCKRESGPTSPDANSGSLSFRVEETGSTQTKAGTVKTWNAIYKSGGKTAKFGIELTLTKGKGEMPVAFGKGAFRHVPDSDSSTLLQDLATTLEAKNWTPPQNRTNTFTFVTAVLGVDLSRGRGKDMYAGSFTGDPKGDWICTKVFAPDGDKDGEFFLNLNSKTGDGEIAIKDPEYGDTVLHELARVL